MNIKGCILLILPLLPAAAVTEVRAGTVKFAGRDWLVGEGPCQSGNICAPENVWVDDEGLHLRLSTAAAGGFRSASVESVDYTRYGMHRFYVRGPVADLHKNVVLGLFTYRNRKDLRDNDFIDADLIPLGEGEIDIELTRWGGTGAAANSHFTVQEGPTPPAGNSSSERFALDDCSGTDCYTTHYFDWEPGRIRFKSFRGHSPEPPKGPGWAIHSWEYPRPWRSKRDIPREALPKVIMNLYRADPDDSSPGQPVEIIITAAALPIERAPVLSSGTVLPASADPEDGVYFYVDYQDPDGDAPEAAQLELDGKTYEMSLFSGSPAAGTYRVGPLAAPGGKEYSFLFDDGHGGITRLPAPGSPAADTAK